jgi:hypothetical protein
MKCVNWFFGESRSSIAFKVALLVCAFVFSGWLEVQT